jgi:hypothetical protein
MTIVDCTVHFFISGHEVTLEDLDKLERDDERDGDECGVEDEIGAESYSG